MPCHCKTKLWSRGIDLVEATPVFIKSLELLDELWKSLVNHQFQIDCNPFYLSKYVWNSFIVSKPVISTWKAKNMEHKNLKIQNWRRHFMKIHIIHKKNSHHLWEWQQPDTFKIKLIRSHKCCLNAMKKCLHRIITGHEKWIYCQDNQSC